MSLPPEKVPENFIHADESSRPLSKITSGRTPGGCRLILTFQTSRGAEGVQYGRIHILIMYKVLLVPRNYR
jgi:hypothetical protein